MISEVVLENEKKHSTNTWFVVDWLQRGREATWTGYSGFWFNNELKCSLQPTLFQQTAL